MKNDVKGLVSELDSMYVRTPFRTLAWWMGYGHIGLRKGSKGQVYLTDFWVEERFRGHGHAKKMLLLFLALCDKHGVVCRTYAESFDKGSRGRRSTPSLNAWYQSLGFNTVPRSDYIVRQPVLVKSKAKKRHSAKPSYKYTKPSVEEQMRPFYDTVGVYLPKANLPFQGER